MTDFPLPEELKRELDRRLADIEANPDDEVPWEAVKTESLADLRQIRSEDPVRLTSASGSVNEQSD